MPRRLPLINSTVAFALALLVMITLHELAHGVVAVGFGFRPVIHASTETDPATEVGTQVTILLAGPVWSLISGLVVLAVPQLSAQQAFWRLAVLWFGLVSVQEFSGYLVVGAFTDVGDTGTVYQLLDTPLWVKIIVLLIGIALMYLTARVAIARLLQLTDPRPRCPLSCEAWVCSHHTADRTAGRCVHSPRSVVTAGHARCTPLPRVVRGCPLRIRLWDDAGLRHIPSTTWCLR